MEDNVRLFYSQGLSGSISTKNPFISELVMEAFIEENPSIVGDEFSIISSELSLRINPAWKIDETDSDRDRTAGRIDLLGYDNDTNALVVIELKKEGLTNCSLLQLLAYMDALEQMRLSDKEAFLSLVGRNNVLFDEASSKEDMEAVLNCSIKGLLIGDSIDANLEQSIKTNSLGQWTAGLESANLGSGCRFRMKSTFSPIPPVSAIILNRYRDTTSGKITIVAEDIIPAKSGGPASKFTTLNDLISARNAGLPGIRNPRYGMGPNWPKGTGDYLFVKLDSLLTRDLQNRHDLTVTPNYGPGSISYYGFGASTGSRVFLYMDIQSNAIRISMYIDPESRTSLERILEPLKGLKGTFRVNDKNPANPNFSLNLNDGYDESDDPRLLQAIAQAYNYRCN